MNYKESFEQVRSRWKLMMKHTIPIRSKNDARGQNRSFYAQNKHYWVAPQFFTVIGDMSVVGPRSYSAPKCTVLKIDKFMTAICETRELLVWRKPKVIVAKSKQTKDHQPCEMLTFFTLKLVYFIGHKIIFMHHYLQHLTRRYKSIPTCKTNWYR
jgi:hypothetical protein